MKTIGLLCLCVVMVVLSGPAVGTPVIQHDPRSSYAPDSNEVAVDRSELVRAMVPMDDATFWTVMLVERKEEQASVRDFLLSLKEGVSRLIPDWLRHLRDDSPPAEEDSDVKRGNAKAITELSAVLDANKVPQSTLVDDARVGVARQPAVEVNHSKPDPKDKASGSKKVPLSQLFLSNSLPGMIQGGQRFLGPGGGAIRLGGSFTDASGGTQMEKSRSRQVSGRLERITQWFHNLLVFLTGFYTYMVLGTLLGVYLLVRYLLQRPRMG